MFDWKIFIKKTDIGTEFEPEQLEAAEYDTVSWTNNTEEVHQPWPTDKDGKPLPDDKVPRMGPLYLSDPINPGKPSRPSYVVRKENTVDPAKTTITYCCKQHPDERGSMKVS